MDFHLRLDHIGVVVRDLEAARKYYEKTFGFKAISEIVDEPEQKVQLIFMECGYSTRPMIELITPVSHDSPVKNFLTKTGGGLHHLAYEVSDVDKAIGHFKSLGAMMISAIVPGAGHGGVRTIWLFTKERELIELIEAKH